MIDNDRHFRTMREYVAPSYRFLCAKKRLLRSAVRGRSFSVKRLQSPLRVFYSTAFGKMTGKLPKSAMSLKQFMVHQEVVKLYRDIMRSIRQIPDEADRKYFRDWARNDFKANKNVTDEFVVKSLILHGENSLKELRKNLNLSGNNKCS